jgi:hypothetical protein
VIWLEYRIRVSNDATPKPDPRRQMALMRELMAQASRAGSAA